MNTNELVTIGEHLQSLNDDNLAQRVFDGTEVQNFIGGTLEHLSHTRIRETATEPPTREDADRDGLVTAYSNACCYGYRNYEEVARYPNTYLFWTCAPHLPEVTP